MPNWTEDQKSAIDSRRANLLVSAAAGSGKTAVLVERIIQLVIEDRVDIDRMLIVTFTNAAAGEMRDRIMRALSEKITNGTEDEAFLRRQIALVHRAHIMTVHAFCIDVVRHYFYEIDIDPAFRIGDTAELSLMMESALEETMEEAYALDDENFHNLVESYASNRSDDGLKELIMKLYFFIQSQPDAISWLEEQQSRYEQAADMNENAWMQAFLESVKEDLNMASEVIEEGQRICNMPDGPAPYLDTFEGDKLVVDTLKVAIEEGFESLYEALSQVKFKRLASIKKADKDSINLELIDAAKAIRDILKKKVIGPIQDMVLKKNADQHRDEMLALAPVMEALAKCVKAFHERYGEMKREKNLLDFNDLEHFTIAILKNPDISKAYRRQFEYIFLDEYQDSNGVQEALINAIRREDNLFLVGDVKQSIYRFRLADPSLFLEKYKTYEKNEQAVSRRIDLAMNFRSSPQILHGINYIFENLMSEKFGEMAYDDDARLYPGLAFKLEQQSPLDVLVIDSGAEDTLDDQNLIEMKKVEIEAHGVAQKIKQVIGTQIYDPKKDIVREVRFRDIVILLRATKSWSSVFTDVLSEYGIPLFTDTGGGYFEALEIEMFMALLKLVDNSFQDLPLLTVLRSPLAGFTVDELIQIRLTNPSATYYEALGEVALMDSALGCKVQAFLDKLNVWKENERIWRLDTFLWDVMVDSGFYHYVGAMQGGTSRQANLRLLIDKAGQFETLGSGGLFEFIAFFEKLKASSGDMGTASSITEGEDVIRLMSIHKSKGLEFPVVILAGAGKQFNLRDTYDKALLHKDYGVGLRFVDPEKRYYSESLPQMIMKRRLKMESLAEEMRILYVAMTRAVNQLIVIGSSGRFESDLKRWVRGASTFNLVGGKSYLDWILSILSVHPDGGPIRERSDLPVFGSSDAGKCKWTIDFIRKDELLMDGLHVQSANMENDDIEEVHIDAIGAEKEMDLKRDELQIGQEAYTEADIQNWEYEIERRLSWTYPGEKTVNMPFKLSVSDLKRASKVGIQGANVHIPPLTPKPKFLTGKVKKSGAEIGTLHHFVMQHLDFKADLSAEGVRGQVQHMVHMNLMDQEDMGLIRFDDIARFFTTDLGARLLASKQVYREVPFILNKVINETQTMVQGIIDCYFEEEDGLIVLDYKTDYTGKSGVEAIATTYKVQVELYKEALEKLLEKPVKASYLYFFDAGTGIKVE